MNLGKIILYSIAFVAVFILSVFVSINVFIKEEGTIAVPDVRGRDAVEARRMIEQKGLGFTIARYEKRKDVQYNRVIMQRPEALLPVRKERTVTVVVSEGPLAVSIPMLLDHSLAYAEKVLKERSLQLKATLNVPDGVVDRVVAQLPRSGENIVDEEGMTLVVGEKRKRYFLMPVVQGKKYQTVINELDRLGIPFRITNVARPDLPAHVIVDASVPPRTFFNEDDTLEIKVNLGG
jgi:beta-lactam-binding protein with PASTA domain